ncbi:MAG: 4Fe-4S dicluster domain-containing protein [Gammaproteobacteria bacterium]|nr:4Fe-4S dicluster domain-containing protein [Gammaproteobacteria bacterium]MDH5801794.1 4Fe-4S dicluster domain-containing protein [Gammaproteobacteria bacterium]
MNDDRNKIDTYRRKFLGQGAALAGTITLAPGVLLHNIANAKPKDQAVDNKVRWGFLIDANKCAANCNACVTACSEENGLTGFNRPETDAQWIRKVTVKDRSTGHTTHLPMMCQHCANPPCVDVCPTGASFQRADGICLVDKHICIGCRYCMMACPYKARSFVHETLTDQVPGVPRGKGTVESCTLCVHRVDRGDIPACAEACTGEEKGAILFGNLNDPNSEIAQRVAKEASTQVRGDLGLDPGVRYQGL